MYKSSQLLLIVLLLYITLNSQESIQQPKKTLHLIKKSIEQKVKKLAKQLQYQYQKNCTHQLSICSIKSFNLCLGTDTRSCLQNYQTPAGCLNQGLFLSSTSGVRFPNIFQSNSLNFDTRLFICTSAMIQHTFLQIQHDNQDWYLYSYIGSSSGAIRISPSFRQSLTPDGKKCIDYDPRIRPWYISSITGQKIIVILFDISKTMTSMHPGARFKSAQITLQIIFTTLNNFDHVGFIVFSTNAFTLPGFSTIFQANQNNKNNLLNSFQSIQTVDGITNYTAAFELAISMLNNYSTNCQSTYFVILTDGYTQNDDIISFYYIIPNLINDNLNSNLYLKLVSFVYGSQSNIKYKFVTTLTNLYQGLLIRIVDGIDYSTMIDKLTPYFAFISQGLNIKTQPMWSQPYEDLQGQGTIMSVTLPVYAFHRIPKIIGVAAIDVLVSRLLQQQIFVKIPQCQFGQIDNLTLLYIRCIANDINDNCSSIIVQNNYNKYNCQQNLSMNIFYQLPLDTSFDQNKCCGLTIKQFLFILFLSLGVGIFVILLIVAYRNGVLLYIVKKKYKRKIYNCHENDSEYSSQQRLIDVENKYKDAQQSGIKIYHQPQFTL